MATIHILDNSTIDQIAAGEVVERPVSIVKELVENAIDAGATIITVEIKDGGIKMIRVTDNGSGIEASQVRTAFLPHATSKITSSSDLSRLYTLGFRGEALSSIAAVSRIEITTRTKEALEGVNYQLEGGDETGFKSVGAPLGTTIIVRDIFYNTLPRLKFLKTPQSEGNIIADMMEHMALSRPDISFQFIANGNIRFSTSGKGDLKEVIYRIFGREVASSLRKIEVSEDELSMKINGYLGIPAINRSNRASEIFFINRRYIKSPMISRAVEEGYVEYLMQHKFPFCVLDFTFDPAYVDVNVHPTKQEVRISDEKKVSDIIVDRVRKTLSEREMLDDAAISYNAADKTIKLPAHTAVPQSFEQERIKKDASINSPADNGSDHETSHDISGFEVNFDSDDLNESEFPISSPASDADEGSRHTETMITPDRAIPGINSVQEEYDTYVTPPGTQESFSDDERVFSERSRRQYRIIGQLFKTYWLIEYKDTLMIMDQHAAHEKVNFEHFMTRLNEKREIPSQMIAPPVVYTLNNREMQTLLDNIQHFAELGFNIDRFGEHEIAIRSVPMDLYGEDPGSLVGEIISDLLDMKKGQTPDSIRTRIATMACKASVKGNNTMLEEEIEALLDEMLTLDNPYNCPHGRPTLITMSKYELDKRFHRIV